MEFSCESQIASLYEKIIKLKNVKIRYTINVLLKILIRRKHTICIE